MDLYKHFFAACLVCAGYVIDYLVVMQSSLGHLPQGTLHNCLMFSYLGGTPFAGERLIHHRTDGPADIAGDIACR